MKTKLKSIIAYHMAVGHRVAAAMVCALCAVGLSAFAEESVTINEVKSVQPWDKAKGTITVDYSLGGLDAAKEYKVAFDITANGVTKGVTNAAAKLAQGPQTVFTNDTVSLFGAETRAEDAKVKVSLIACKAVEANVRLWSGGPYWATSNLGTSEVAGHPEYGALYKFDDADKAVKSLLGEEWRVPSKDEFSKLVDTTYCTRTWDDTRKGYVFTGATDGYTDKSIFLPAAGSNNGEGRTQAESYGYYWTSDMADSSTARELTFNKYGSAYTSGLGRNMGLSVRAVSSSQSYMSEEVVVAFADETFVLGTALAVKNVRTATHWPWDGKIDVTCDLTGMGKVTLSAALTTNGVKVCDATAENITGETTINLDAAGGVTNGVKFTWDAKADCPAGFNSKDTKVKVTAEKVVPPPPGQLWKDGPIWADSNLGTSEVQDHPEYGAPYNFAAAGTEVAKLGDGWRLPTKDECQSLIDKCDRTWNDTEKGYTFTGRGDYASNSVFLPAAGYDKGSGRVIAGRSGLYWSSEVRGDFYAWAFFFQDGMAYMSEYGRNFGLSIRVVRDAK